MDDEFVRHALGALTVPETLKSASAASKRVDIRTLTGIRRTGQGGRNKGCSFQAEQQPTGAVVVEGEPAGVLAPGHRAHRHHHGGVQAEEVTFSHKL